MRIRILCVCLAAAVVACAPTGSHDAASPAAGSGADPALSAFIAQIRAVDNHSHANSVTPGDADADALPLDGVAPFELPTPLRPDNPDWIAAYRALYKYQYDDLADAHLAALRTAMQKTAQEQGASFPAWVLDQVGTEVLLANRIAMGPGLPAPRFRWVWYVDALMLPLPTTAEGATSPDRVKLFPLEDALLKRYFTDLQVAQRPVTLDAYLKTVVTPTLEAQRQAGCLAVKFEAAYLRSLAFDDVPLETASRVYARYAASGVPSLQEYKALQDFLFRFIAREAGRLGMAVHIHAFEGAGNYFDTAGADPLLLEPVFDDPALRQTNFVIVHGGGVFAGHTGAMLWKPNVYADTSLMTLAYPTSRLAGVLREWLAQFPEKVLYGSDAVANGPDMGWDVAAWVAGQHARAALAHALTDMMAAGEIARDRAQAIATMVMRTNAAKLYTLNLK